MRDSCVFVRQGSLLNFQRYLFVKSSDGHQWNASTIDYHPKATRIETNEFLRIFKAIAILCAATGVMNMLSLIGSIHLHMMSNTHFVIAVDVRPLMSFLRLE